jgi:hypothetical protein
MPSSIHLLLSIFIVCSLICCEKRENTDKATKDKNDRGIIITSEQETIARLEKRIGQAYDLWLSKNEPRETYNASLRKILESLSEDEVRLVAQHVGFESEKEAFRMWARFDPAGALKEVRAIENANAEEIKLAGSGLEGGPGEGMQRYVYEMYLGAIDGWAEVALKTAWESFKERKGPLSNSLVIEDYVTRFYRVLFEHLAKVDPDQAFNELISFRSDDFEEMCVASMLGGYLRSAPRGRDWRNEADRLLERKWESDGRLYSEIRTALMGRWLADAPEAAEKWFQDGDVEGLHWSYIDSPEGDDSPFLSEEARAKQKKIVRDKLRNDLASASGYWSARDFPAAWSWMKSYKGNKREGFGAAVLHGSDVFHARRASYYVGGPWAQPFILMQAAKLPDEQDRQACISMINEADFDTEYLHGVPLP